MVVDDMLLNRVKLARGLERQGYSVSLAEDGEQALAMLQEEPFDVVLLDIMMPGLDGYEVLSRMKGDAQLRDIPVIVISALDEMESVVRCIEMGAEDYLPKPFNPVLLKARLNASLQKKKLRDLEKVYLQQEIMLRQSEKLATLGRLSAGMAHELNNPTAAVQRGAGQLQELLQRRLTNQAALMQLQPTPRQVEMLEAYGRHARERAWQPDILDPLARSDREGEMELWLDEAGVVDGWELAPVLVDMALSREELTALADAFHGAQLSVVLHWLATQFTIQSILHEIGEGTGRIADIVRALKMYSYLDQAPVQSVNIHEGLENTLVILRNKLKAGVTIQRDYAPDLPSIEAYGSELNQVWTNIIDNAVDAMNGAGTLTLRTQLEDAWIVVEIEDNGPGIPEAIQRRVFDPFFTTKAPGEGTGLGLNISHNIIVQNHEGEIGVTSEPGRTCFRIRLPR